MDNPFFIYALVSQFDGRIYVGMSQDIDRRLTEHNAGKVKSTKGFVPWVLFFKELAGNAEQARTREKYYKAASGKKKLKAILQAKVS
ncbi:MAG TPA: GIY-YIG nuclease family protein [Tenuifilaceae bacterium]|nr:GIY-YIG nuclease family protein [Tenuifilaceae bacterium]HPE17009.1 GIY-YIG nuclease family protein [Tenuifilaceae bacterium]HPJ44706.1 GIY-YIG nuclease family protein [Tenuifilaceae bacterium]HPQ32970.1 GIY-YIG nuclease family protein [Tenuifilaceae bacterium]HRX66788.1 GIY-YIG nuclease family protein [Tenuifilaceae bacterium]